MEQKHFTVDRLKIIIYNIIIENIKLPSLLPLLNYYNYKKDYYKLKVKYHYGNDE